VWDGDPAKLDVELTRFITEPMHIKTLPNPY
jgi:hypothetical protein